MKLPPPSHPSVPVLDPRPGSRLLGAETPEGRELLKLIPNYDKITGAEIGTLRGDTAAHLLSSRPGLYLFMVDNWHTHGLVQDSPGAVRDAAIARTAFAAERRELIEWAPTIPQGADSAFRDFSLRSVAKHAIALDFVFIDAKHDYVSTLADMEAWWPKLRPGGLLCGHDYGREKPDHVPGLPWDVAGAVNDFALRRQPQLAVTILDHFVWAIKVPDHPRFRP